MDDATHQPEEGHDWLEVWKKNLSQIDDKLIELYKDTAEYAGDIGEKAHAKIHELLDKTDMDERARASWEKVKANSVLLADKVEKRVAQLIADGRIALAKLAKKDQDQEGQA